MYDKCLALPCRSASKEIVKAILAAGPRGRHPSIKDVNKHGLTPLGEALVAGRCDVADLLVSEARVCFCDLLTLDTGLETCKVTAH